MRATILPAIPSAFRTSSASLYASSSGVLGIIIVLFQLQVTYGFTAALGALFLVFIAIFLFMLILDVVMLIPILLNSMKKRGWIR